MRAWYDVSFGDLEGNTRRADESGVRASQAQVGRLIEREVERGVAIENIVIAGFSQGGAIALQTGLRYPQRLAGIMALSTYLPLADSLASEGSAANRAIPIFYAHGTHDQVIPLAMATSSRDKITAAGYQVEWHEYPMQHSVCTEEVGAIGAWLVKVLRP
jgi:phospholipase/carboxylesterase